MLNFVQEWHFVIFMPFLIINTVAAIVGIANLADSRRGKRPARRLAPELAARISAASWASTQPCPVPSETCSG